MPISKIKDNKNLQTRLVAHFLVRASLVLNSESTLIIFSLG